MFFLGSTTYSKSCGQVMRLVSQLLWACVQHTLGNLLLWASDFQKQRKEDLTRAYYQKCLERNVEAKQRSFKRYVDKQTRAYKEEFQWGPKGYKKFTQPLQVQHTQKYKPGKRGLSAENFCPQMLLFSQRTADNGYSVAQMPCPAEINAPFIFRHKCAWNWPWKHHGAGNETNVHVAPLSWQTAPFYCCPLLHFVAFSCSYSFVLFFLQNVSALAPRGKMA